MKLKDIFKTVNEYSRVKDVRRLQENRKQETPVKESVEVLSEEMAEMRALAGIDARPMWEAPNKKLKQLRDMPITQPEKEYKSGHGNVSGLSRSPGSGTGEDYEEPEVDGEASTDDPEDVRYRDKEDEEDAETRDDSDEEEPEEEEPEDKKSKKSKKEEARWHKDAVLLEATMSSEQAREVLELPLAWTKAELKSAYKKASLKHHPDRGGSSDMMVKVIAAYNALKNRTSTGQSGEEDKLADEKKKLIVTGAISNLFDPKKFASYFQKMTGKVYTVDVKDEFKDQYKSWYFTKDVEWKSTDGETVFFLHIYVNSRDVADVKSLGGSGGEPNLSFQLMVEPKVLHNNRKSKMRRKNWDFSSKQDTLVDPTKVFPKSSINKMMSGADKNRKFSKRDMLTAIEKKLGGTVDYRGKDIWAQIPVGDEGMHLHMWRSILDRQATWNLHSVRTPKSKYTYDVFRSKGFASMKESELLIDVLHKIQKSKWASPQQLADGASSMIKKNMKASWNEAASETSANLVEKTKDIQNAIAKAKKTSATKDALKKNGVDVTIGKEITVDGKKSYHVREVLKKWKFKFHKNPAKWVKKFDPNFDFDGFYKALLTDLKADKPRSGVKNESLLGGAVPGSEFTKVILRLKDKAEEKKAKKKEEALASKVSQVLESARARVSLQERQKGTPSLGFSDEEKPARKGSFKVSSAALKFWAGEIDKAGGDVSDVILFKKVRDHIHNIPRNDLPEIWGKDNMADAQDVVMGKPKKAFQMWLRNVKKVSPKMHGYLQKVPDNVPLVYFGFLVRVVGMMSAKGIFKRYFETESDHVGSLKGKKGLEAYRKKAKEKKIKDAMARAKKGN